MTHAPPIPEANQSPYPIQEPPHAHHDAAAPPPPVRGGADDDDAASIVDRLRELPLLAVGATIGLGAAILGGAVFGLLRAKPKRRGKRKGRR